ncbi:oxidoreductase [Luteitalea sp. TBR-22]|uniref:Gfo/Idh/MocA family protein n=1 Tax=Luteitalea sp. TBR-22 TaxID=2802971 RepID=UPI001AF02D21|nr:Gfo/Idh/MocA family oxidoreductase [Luteitalea sp. TBR-22]BCS32149.1 oxidoreductase [Luteitalea sp. TBR-22]
MIHRVAVLGLGHWYSAYGLARALPEYPQATLVAAADPDPRRLSTYCDTFRCEAVADYTDVLSREDVDIVHIAAPVRDIPELTMRAARAGKHIVMGKPMAMTVAQADEMVRVVEASGVTCVPFQGLMRLRHQAIKARVAAGEIGDLAVMHQTGRWAIAEDWYMSGTPGWFVDPAQVPGGAFIDEGIYWIDLFRWLAGSEVVEVDARMRNIVHRDLPVEDWGFAVFTFANGVTATLEASWTINAPRVTGPSPKRNSVVRLELVGTRGELMEQWFRSPGGAVLKAGAEDWVFERVSEEAFGPATPMPLHHLITCVEQGVTPAATIRDARDSFVVAMAAYESARQGRPVRLDLAPR